MCTLLADMVLRAKCRYSYCESVTMGRVIKNLVRGVGTLLDIQPSPHRSRASRCLPKRSDAEAMQDDWKQVGDDLRKAMNSYFESPEKR